MTINVIYYKIFTADTPLTPLIIYGGDFVFEKDIDAMKQKLYYAIEQGDKDTIYDISVRLDVLIVEFYNYYKN
ncbi:hypothetical protein OXPF_22120 [Oxobacter pfennigii]|uniref:Spo0E like sporulation regulatory protein n=1 Tax=Oxobacter pfennigii TaxID=36849 RepID=A0A0P9AFB1_9CLOT|nr:hypothetical protein OXPF_22120 [Oxobacter pfennigii]